MPTAEDIMFSTMSDDCESPKKHPVSPPSITLNPAIEKWKFPKFKKYLLDYDNIVENIITYSADLSNINSITTHDLTICKSNNNIMALELTIRRGSIEPKKILVFIKYSKDLEKYDNIIKLMNKYKDIVIISCEGPCWGKSKVDQAVLILNNKINENMPCIGHDLNNINIEIGNKIKIPDNNDTINKKINLSQLISDYNNKSRELLQLMTQINKLIN